MQFGAEGLVTALLTNWYCALVALIDALEFMSRNRVPPNVKLVKSGLPCQ